MSFWECDIPILSHNYQTILNYGRAKLAMEAQYLFAGTYLSQWPSLGKDMAMVKVELKSWCLQGTKQISTLHVQIVHEW